ncbi:class I SAM-dependent DNA methyltransferase [Alkalibacillus aidingensis]|uniref:class I SAM-dependent DNA methyltransferase n=1 Tax=Alkalibacillus aidingensis TaxID=2747607 RepID=UPI001661760B|nr:class I SAM-dependent methyltransferase [Alkalibacillus aidingensis]
MYQRMAQVYDDLMKDAPYQSWVDFTNKQLGDRSTNIHILDAGCGTGEISVRLAQDGYQVSAFDLSEDMIELAEQKQSLSSFCVNFFQADLRSFQTSDLYDVVISYCDVLNYLTEENELEQAFSQVYQHLKEEGQFIFDVHSENYIKYLVDSELFSEVGDEISYVWFCEESQRPSEVIHDLTFFVKDDRTTYYERFDESHIQRTFPVDVYLSLLKSVGFKEVKVKGDFNHQPLKGYEDTDRLFFICQK